MRGAPSPALISLLARLQLATEEQVLGMAPRVRRLAGDLPDFESVWVDSLAQARILTTLQASEINAGRGEELLYGPYVVTHALRGPHFASCFAARHLETSRQVRLYVVPRPQSPAAVTARALVQLAERLAVLGGPTNCVVEDAGLRGQAAWAACPKVDGVTAADWMAEHGRLPPGAVLHVAREMIARIVELTSCEVPHGDLGAAGLLFSPSGHVTLPMPGLRGVVRPSEGYGFHDLQPAAYDYLAPERIAEGVAPNQASDIYACGCLWWHLLTGRAPFAGGNSLARLKSAHAGKVLDVRQLAPETPEVLAKAIELCLARDPGARPGTTTLIQLLGPASRTLARELAGCLSRPQSAWGQTPGRKAAQRSRTKSRRGPVSAAVAATILIAAVASWPVWRRDREFTEATSTTLAKTPAAEKVAESKPNPPNGESPAKKVATKRTQPEPQAGSSDPKSEKSEVVRASGTAPLAKHDLLLSTGAAVRISELNVKPGQTVRGRGGGRPRVLVPAKGLAIAQENVTFENIDFVDERDASGPKSSNAPAAMIVVEASSISFRGCSFSTTARNPASAVLWLGASDAPAGAGGELTFSDCVSNGVSALIDARGGTLAVDVSNSLCLASGPILRVRRPARAEESVTITLDRVTTRGDCSVLECRYARLEEQPGAVTITATDSALDGNPQGGLIIFAGPQSPEPLLRAVTWTGQGSLVTPQTAMIQWRNGKQRQELAEDDLEIAGLVRSEVEFAGEADGPPANSQLERWQVPLRSADPPGANVGSLYLPKP